MPSDAHKKMDEHHEDATMATRTAGGHDGLPPNEFMKRAYVKPAFRFERVFETQALGCGKLPSHGGSCKVHPSAS